MKKGFDRETENKKEKIRGPEEEEEEERGGVKGRGRKHHKSSDRRSKRETKEQKTEVPHQTM